MNTLDEILRIATEKGASDVHLKSGIIPVIRKHGSLRPLSSKAVPLTDEDLEKMAFAIMNPRQKQIFEEKMDVDISYGLNNLGRFRINILRQRGGIRMVIRNVSDNIKSIQELQLPEIIKTIAERERGLVLVTGVTGSGKSTTLAAIVDHINKTKSKHILMIEDPTEYIIRDKKCIITQRELGTDTISFADSLRAALRQDPDVIFIGEMRDRETIEIALLAAETGHLVLSSLHTLDARETINRILSAFEPHQQLQIRLQLASVLSAIVSQRLCTKKDNSGFVPAIEVMLNNTRMSELIADPNKTADIRKAIEGSKNAYGMCTFDQSLMELVNKDLITYEEALKNSTSPENFAIRYNGVSQMDDRTWGKERGQAGDRNEKAWRNITTVDVENPEHDQKVKGTAIKIHEELEENEEKTNDKWALLKKLKR